MSFLDSTYLNWQNGDKPKSYLSLKTIVNNTDRLVIGNIYAIMYPLFESITFGDLIPESLQVKIKTITETDADGNEIIHEGPVAIKAIDYLGNELTFYFSMDLDLLDSHFIFSLLGIGAIIPKWIIPNKEVEITIKWFDRTYSIITDNAEIIKDTQDYFEEYSEFE